MGSKNQSVGCLGQFELSEVCPKGQGANLRGLRPRLRDSIAQRRGCDGSLERIYFWTIGIFFPIAKDVVP